MKKDIFEVIDILTKEFDIDIINTINKKDTVINNEKNI